MTAAELKLKIGQSIQAFSKGSLTANALHLFQTLGYNTERQAPLDKPTYIEFKENYIQPSSPFNETKALVGEWKYVDLLFQLSKEEVLKQTSLFTTKQVDRTAIEAYLFFTIELSGDHYSRTDLAHITREVNRLFAMPVMILFKHGNLLTLSVINRRLHKRDEGRDVLEKVTLIKDIQIQNPHRAHIEILFDLSFDELKNKYSFTNFVELHNAWQKTLDTKELNKRFYRELANWYFWAVQNVEFPADTETVRDLRNATNVIRLITRLIFVWFLKEKGLIPDDLFNQNRLQQILNYIDDNNSTYYKAILQNLFFATLNTEMGKRQFRNRAKNTGDRDQHYMIHNVFRYEDYFAAPEEILRKYFANIPFLNGGLFECLDKRDEITGKQARTDGFSDRKDNVLKVPDELFFSDEQEIDLNNVYGTKNKTYRTRGIINLLNNYKFTIDENTPVEEEVALDPELLGKVFENLLASYNPETGSTARKQTGSFYTPREIVNYMVDASLIAYLQTKLASSSGIIPSPLTGEGQGGGEQRLRHLLSYTDEPHQFNPNEVDILIDAIDSAKILDPACGSGAFPMGILHKLVYILSKLDPNNQKWRQRQINKVMEVPDATVREKLIEDIEQAFQSNELDYGRKLYLIENAIFGVDIQPIAVQIAKLRFFISLIVDQKISYTSPPLAGGAGGGGGGNLGIRPLPNLETKFVAANTLIGIDRPQQLTLRNPDIDKKEAELKKVRERHFTARTPQTKEKYRKEDERLRTEISELLQKDGFTREVTEKLGKWNPYDQNASADFFDPEWMFGIKSPSPLVGESKGEGGFDIVLGNPPYVRHEGIKEHKPQLSKEFGDFYCGTADLYTYFYKKGVGFLKSGGHLCFIAPNKFMRAGYGKNTRTLLAGEVTPKVVIDFGDLPIFDATTYPSIILLEKKSHSRPQGEGWGEGGMGKFLAATFTDPAQLEKVEETLSSIGFEMPVSALRLEGWNLERPEIHVLMEKLRTKGKPLGEYVNGRFYRGVLTGLNEAFVIDTATRERLIVEDSKSGELIKPWLRGRDIRKWKTEWAGLYVINIPSSANKQWPWSGVKDESKARLIFTRTYPSIHAHLLQWEKELKKRDDQGKFWWELRSCAYYGAFEGAKIIWGNLATEPKFAFDSETCYVSAPAVIIPTDDLSLLSVLNSPLCKWWISLQAAVRSGGFLEYKPMYVETVPVIPANDKQKTHIFELVRIILAHPDSPDIPRLEAEINKLVYALYNLSQKEIEIIENSR